LLFSKENTHVIKVAESNGRMLKMPLLADMGKTKTASETGSSYNLD